MPSRSMGCIRACLLLAGAAALPPAAWGVDPQLPASLSVQGHTLELTSCGVRDTFWIDHYAAGLYVPPGASPQAAQNPRQPSAVRLEVMQARYLPERIPEKWRHALERELQREPMMRVRRAYGQLSDGDVVTFAYRPEQSVTMRVNGRLVESFSGHDVIDAILDAWAEKDRLSQKLQRLPLEHPCRPPGVSQPTGK